VIRRVLSDHFYSGHKAHEDGTKNTMQINILTFDFYLKLC
jgi:hypothetical protein